MTAEEESGESVPFDCIMGGFGSFYLDWNWKSELELFSRYSRGRQPAAR